MSKILFMVLLALVSLACGLQTNFPNAKTPSPEVTDPIVVTAPTGNTHLTLTFGAGKLTLAPGATKLVEGTVMYNIPDLKPTVKLDGGNVSITEGNTHGLSILNPIKNEWQLKLGPMPMDLTINSGAYQGNFDLGGLALTHLTINDGAAQVMVDFSSLNKEILALLSYKTGTSNVTLNNLGNANFETLIFEGGVGKYKLDFGGTFQRAGNVTIHAGMSSLMLVIPTGLASTVKVNSGMSNVQVPSDWSKNAETYTQAGSGPPLTIVIEMGMGSLQITQ